LWGVLKEEKKYLRGKRERTEKVIEEKLRKSFEKNVRRKKRCKGRKERSEAPGARKKVGDRGGSTYLNKDLGPGEPQEPQKRLVSRGGGKKIIRKKKDLGKRKKLKNLPKKAREKPGGD